MARIDRNQDEWSTTDIMNAGRVLSKGEITVANSEFKLTGKVPYSLFLLPNPPTEDIWQIISVKLQQDLVLSDYPFNVGSWNEASIDAANITSDLLTKYRIFWGAGTAIEGGV